MNTRIVLVAALTWFLTAAASASDTKIYRYMDSEGYIEISRSLPPDRARYGYQVLDGRSGACLEGVPAAEGVEGPTLLFAECPGAAEIADQRRKIEQKL